MSWKGPDAHQEELLWKALWLFALLFIVCVGLGIAAAFVCLLTLLQNILLPMGLAAILAYLLHPLVSLLERLRLSRTWATVLLFALALAAVAAAGVFLGPKLVREAERLAQSAPQWFNATWGRVTAFLAANQDGPLGNVVKHADESAAKISAGAWESVGKVAHTFGFLFGMVFIPFYLFYFLADQPRIARVWKDYVPIRESSVKREVVVVIEQINKYLISFFRGQVIVAATDGVLLAVGLCLIGLDYGLLIGTAAAFLTIIPYFGILATCLVSVLVAANQDDGGARLVGLTLAVFAAVQTLENTLISPRVMNEKTGLHPVTVIVSILIWSSFLGPLLGAILAVPLTATLKVLLARYALIKKTGSDAHA